MKRGISLVFFLFLFLQILAQDPNGFATFKPIISQDPRNQGASVKYTQSCVVRYLSSDGWSKRYSVNVTFISGLRLNEATRSFDYESFAKYALIFWGEGQATIIRISTFLACNTDISRECITNTIGDIEGKDQEDRDWKICVSNYCYN